MALARASFLFIFLQHICDQLVSEVSMTCQWLWDKEGNKSCYLTWRLSEVIGPRVFLGFLSGTFLHAYRTAFHVRRHFPTRQKKKKKKMPLNLSGLFWVQARRSACHPGVRFLFQHQLPLRVIDRRNLHSLQRVFILLRASPNLGMEAHISIPFPILFQVSFSFLYEEDNETLDSVLYSGSHEW